MFHFQKVSIFLLSWIQCLDHVGAFQIETYLHHRHGCMNADCKANESLSQGEQIKSVGKPASYSQDDSNYSHSQYNSQEEKISNYHSQEADYQPQEEKTNYHAQEADYQSQEADYDAQAEKVQEAMMRYLEGGIDEKEMQEALLRYLKESPESGGDEKLQEAMLRYLEETSSVSAPATSPKVNDGKNGGKNGLGTVEIAFIVLGAVVTFTFLWFLQARLRRGVKQEQNEIAQRDIWRKIKMMSQDDEIPSTEEKNSNNANNKDAKVDVKGAKAKLSDAPVADEKKGDKNVADTKKGGVQNYKEPVTTGKPTTSSAISATKPFPSLQSLLNSSWSSSYISEPSGAKNTGTYVIDGIYLGDGQFLGKKFPQKQTLLNLTRKCNFCGCGGAEDGVFSMVGRYDSNTGVLIWCETYNSTFGSKEKLVSVVQGQLMGHRKNLSIESQFFPNAQISGRSKMRMVATDVPCMDNYPEEVPAPANMPIIQPGMVAPINGGKPVTHGEVAPNVHIGMPVHVEENGDNAPPSPSKGTGVFGFFDPKASMGSVALGSSMGSAVDPRATMPLDPRYSPASDSIGLADPRHSPAGGVQIDPRASDDDPNVSIALDSSELDPRSRSIRLGDSRHSVSTDGGHEISPDDIDAVPAVVGFKDESQTSHPMHSAFRNSSRTPSRSPRDGGSSIQSGRAATRSTQYMGQPEEIMGRNALRGAGHALAAGKRGTSVDGNIIVRGTSIDNDP